VAATQRVPEVKWTEAVLLLVFAYGGFESSVVAASESRDPKRDTAFALAVGMGLITLIYCLVQVAVLGVLPDAGRSTTPVASAFGVVFGGIGTTLGSLAVIVSVYGWLVGVALMNPRIMYSMAERGELPSVLARVHPRFRTPHVAIVASSLVILAAGLYGSFSGMAAAAAIVRLGIYLVVCAALVALRRKEGRAPFSLLAGPAFAVVGIAFCLWMLSTRPWAQAWPILAIVGVGFVLWAVGRRARGRTPATPR
jgi:APA family basic amino acid/polyamine antiporter